MKHNPTHQDQSIQITSPNVRRPIIARIETRKTNFNNAMSIFFISTLFLKFCHKTQEIEECSFKLCAYIDHHGTYTPLWGDSALLLKTCHKKQEIRRVL